MQKLTQNGSKISPESNTIKFLKEIGEILGDLRLGKLFLRKTTISMTLKRIN